MKLVFKLENCGAAATAFQRNKPRHFDEAKTVGIKNGGIAHGLQEEVSVEHEITIVVEALADIAQIEPYSL